MNILALEPYYGGSHKSFLDGLKAHSVHHWEIFGLPAYKWKWRMRHAPMTFAQQLEHCSDKSFDLLFCTDMLNLAEFKGIVSPKIATLPSIIYFHENQLTYPVQEEKKRDYHFAYSNFVSAKAADAVWFNSHFHRNSFLEALEQFLKRMPDFQSLNEIDNIREKSEVVYPGIETTTEEIKKNNKTPHFLWNARWEFDKNPELFFEVLFQLHKESYDFHLSILGEQFDSSPVIFDKAKNLLADKIVNFGFVESKKRYFEILSEADFVISTANHEFYGIAILEAVAYGCIPILPNRLSYPELFQSEQNHDLFYDGSYEALLNKLRESIKQFPDNKYPDNFKTILSQFSWNNISTHVDTLLKQICKN